MLIGMKALNEERMIDRVIGDIHGEPWVEKIIVIDGWSTDYTVQELKQWDKCEIYLHKWENWYHDQEIVQSNILMSYIPYGQVYFILDFDERCSQRLKDALAYIDEHGMPGGAEICHVSRKTIEVLRYEDSPHAILGEDGWPIEAFQVGQYPDFQCRIIQRQPKMYWINSPHHELTGWNKNLNLSVDLIHYEKDDLRDRTRIERSWARCQARRKELGLTADSFEGRVQHDVHKYTNPDNWS